MKRARLDERWRNVLRFKFPLQVLVPSSGHTAQEQRMPLSSTLDDMIWEDMAEQRRRQNALEASQRFGDQGRGAETNDQTVDPAPPRTDPLPIGASGGLQAGTADADPATGAGGAAQGREPTRSARTQDDEGPDDGAHNTALPTTGSALADRPTPAGDQTAGGTTHSPAPAQSAPFSWRDFPPFTPRGTRPGPTQAPGEPERDASAPQPPDAMPTSADVGQDANELKRQSESVLKQLTAPPLGTLDDRTSSLTLPGGPHEGDQGDGLRNNTDDEDEHLHPAGVLHGFVDEALGKKPPKDPFNLYRGDDGQPGSGDERDDPSERNWNDTDAKVILASRRGGNYLQGTPAQQMRLSLATNNATSAMARVRQVDPTWRGPSSWVSGIEGHIAHQLSVARAAEARLTELARGGYGSNSGAALGSPPGLPPPAGGTLGGGTLSGARPPFNPPSHRIPPQGPDMIDAYRHIWRMPSGDDNTVAAGTMDGQLVLGVNSSAPGYTQADRDHADQMRGRLVQSDPDIMATDNLGHMPNNALYHAEGTALMRAARQNGGTLAGRTLEIHVDRPMCKSCDKVLPLIIRELGYPNVTFRDSNGKHYRLRGDRMEAFKP